MTRREAYDAIVARMHKPENRERYDALCMCNDKKNDDALIEMHMKHVREFLTTLEQSIELIENGAFGDGSTFTVSKGSYAESWVKENLFSYTYTEGDNLDWLN